MKALTNIHAHSLADAVAAASAAVARGRAFACSGGGTDLLQQIKDGTNQADVLINLRPVREARTVSVSPTETLIGGLHHPDRACRPCRAVGAMGGAAGGRRQRGDAADTPRGHAGRECHATPLVLVLPHGVPLLQGRGLPVLLVPGREPTTRDLWWRSEF